MDFIPVASSDSAPRSLVAPLRILVTALSSVMGGGVTVATNLTAAMAACFPEHAILLYCSDERVARAPYPENVDVTYLPALLRRWQRLLWEQVRLPSIAAKRGADVTLALGGYTPFFSTIPQVAVWQNPNVFSPPGVPRPLSERLLVRAQRLAQSASMRFAAQNVFLTQTSLDLAARVWPMDRFPHCVIHSGVAAERLEVSRAAPLSSREHFVLAVGHTYSHKNYEAMIDAVDVYRRRFDPPIKLRVFGGPANPSYFDALRQRVVDKDLTGLVDFMGEASHDVVLQQMSRARIYLATSLLETFGLTLLEAMGQGLPVVASHSTCHPEVCGDAALYCDPHDPQQIAKQLHRVATDPTLASSLRERGLARVGEFSWQRAAKSYVEQLAAAARSRSRNRGVAR